MDTKTLLDRLSQTTPLSAEDGKKVVDALAAFLGDAGAELDVVGVPGFGSFEPRKRMERVNVHPATGRRMLLPPKIALTFKPSALLKQKLK